MFDENKPDWSKEYAELKALLAPEEYEAARGSTLNAHYTSPAVIKAIYEAVGSIRLEGGRTTFEPSMGVGNFFGLLPGEHGGQANSTAWSWTASPGASPSSSIPRPTSLSRGL